MRILKLVPLFALCLLVGCETVMHGRVTHKEIEPANTILMPMMIGKFMVLMPITYPEAYAVTLQGVDKKGNAAQETIFVERQQFDLIREGDKFDCGGSQEVACITDRPGGSRP